MVSEELNKRYTETWKRFNEKNEAWLKISLNPEENNASLKALKELNTAKKEYEKVLRELNEDLKQSNKHVL